MFLLADYNSRFSNLSSPWIIKLFSPLLDQLLCGPLCLCPISSADIHTWQYQSVADVSPSAHLHASTGRVRACGHLSRGCSSPVRVDLRFTLMSGQERWHTKNLTQAQDRLKYSFNPRLFLVSKRNHVTSMLANCIPLSPLNHPIRTDYLGTELLCSRRPFRSDLSCQDCGERVDWVSRLPSKRKRSPHLTTFLPTPSFSGMFPSPTSTVSQRSPATSTLPTKSRYRQWIDY